MNRMDGKKWNVVLIGFLLILFLAGLADIKYKGLFYQRLPKSIQAYLTK